jgi:hypothetical protein
MKMNTREEAPMPRTTTPTTSEVARELVSLCRDGRNLEAIDSFYANDVISIESVGDDTMPAKMQGIDAVRGKNQWWMDNHELHGQTVEGPYLGDGQFAVHYTFDVTNKTSGERVNMSEMALYTVKDGKVVAEQFFYNPS